MSGLSTTGIISFGLALVAGKNRLPKPATGNTAFVIARITRFLDLNDTESLCPLVLSEIGEPLRGSF